MINVLYNLFHVSPQSLVKQMMVYKSVNSTSNLEFHTEMKIAKSILVQKLVLLVHAGSVELVLLVQGGHLWLEHDRELIGQANSTGVVGGVEG